MSLQTTPARRGRKPRPQTRENLIQVGARMVHAAGYAATGVKDIVDAAEVPKGSFYNHFASKEDFGREVVDFYFQTGVVRLRALLGNDSLPPLERLKAVFEESIRSYQTVGYSGGCMMGNLSLEVADHSDLIRERLAVHFTTWSRLFETCIAEAQQSGAVGNRLPASLLAQFLLNSWEGALLRMRVERSDRPLREFTDVIFAAVLV